MPTCKRIFFSSVIALMLGLLSGAPAAAIQGFAWIYMAGRSTGDNSLTKLVFVDPPCRYCEMAEEVNQQSGSQEGMPLSTGQLAALKLTSVLSESPALLPVQQWDLVNLQWHSKVFVCPAMQVDNPPTPPPRTIQA